MRTVTTRFQEVSLFSQKIGKCEVCGKVCNRKQKFSQTVNPFNKNPDGSIKTPVEIHQELKFMAERWKSEPVKHARCE